MKNLIYKAFALLLLVFGLSVEVRGQYVAIPDAIFRTYLQQQYPTCFNGQNQMDTTCANIVNETQLNLVGMAINSLRGIEYFDNLTSLNCSDNYLTSLIKLPNSIQSLDCSENDLTSIASLPLSLTYLNCNRNDLTTLPSLPPLLTYLNCFGNDLTFLPALPNGLQTIMCTSNDLTTLPQLPQSLIDLNCGGNPLPTLPMLPNGLLRLTYVSAGVSVLPQLPNSLQSLDCSFNQIAQLPALPNNLDNLNCGANQLTYLPTLPNGLDTLWLANNSITNLPSLPDSLKFLNCCNNGPMVTIPTLPSGLKGLICGWFSFTDIPLLPPSLETLTCYNSQIVELPVLPDNLWLLSLSGNTNLMCLPFLPASLQHLDIAYNPTISCLPNIPPLCNTCQTLQLCQDPAQICTTGSAFCTGDVFLDWNLDGIKNNGETNIENFIVNATPGSYVSATSPNGYILQLDTVATTTVSIYNPYPLAVDIVPQNHIVNTTGPGEVPGSFDFAIQPLENAPDIEVHIAPTIARRGFFTYANIRVSNVGTVIDSPLLTLSFPPDWVVQNTLPQGVVNGNSVTWQDTALSPFSHHNFSVQFYIPQFVPIGTAFTYTASVPIGNDITPINNIAITNGEVIGSYDPNDKTCNTEHLNPGYDPEQELLYTVRFQNTGNDTAFTVVVRDTLSQYLRANTVRVVNSSHDLDLHFIDYSHVLTFIFPNINLVDSFANEPLSHGFVQFAVKPQPNLPVGTSIENAADIYFDFNAPIRTNTVTTNVDIVSVPQLESKTFLKIYPNPTNGRVRIQAPEALADGATVVVSDMMGRTCLSVPCMGSGADVSMDGLPSGVYSAAVVSDGRVLYRGLVVKR